VLAVLLAATAIVFRDKITDGPFSGRTNGIRFFEQHENALNAYVERLIRDEDVERAICYSDSVWIEGADGAPSIAPTDQQLMEYLSLCNDAGSFTVWRVDGGYLFYTGPTNSDGKDFNVAFVWRANHSVREPRCSSVVELRDFGKCVFPLSKEWSLDYEWTPIDFNSPREKELMDVTKDFAETLSHP